MLQSEPFTCLEASIADHSHRLIGPLIRFFAHLVLILRTLNQPLPDEAPNAIVQAYLQILERESNDSLVAMYAACLREGSGEESYARFLRGRSMAGQGRLADAAGKPWTLPRAKICGWKRSRGRSSTTSMSR